MARVPTELMAALPNESVHMVLPSLSGGLPEPLPLPFRLRGYEPGDEAHWVRIHELADRYLTVTRETFEANFGMARQLLPARQFYLLDEAGEPIGTASAWFNPRYQGEAWGQVHWVAIVPAYQGRGLARPLLTAVLHRLDELGHGRAYLGTSTARVPAIGLYLRYGFRPDLRFTVEIAAWQRLATLFPEVADALTIREGPADR